MGTKKDFITNRSHYVREASITVILNIILSYVTLSTDVIDNWWDPVKQGFTCFDDSLSRPLQRNTVPTKTLFIFALGAPIVVIILTELWIGTSSSGSSTLTRIYKALGDGLFGLACICLLTNMTKYVVGRLR